MKFSLTPGQSYARRLAEVLPEELREGTILLADRAYNSIAVRALAKERKAWINIPLKCNRKSLQFRGHCDPL